MQYTAGSSVLYLFYLGAQDKDIADKLSDAAERAKYDLFTAAYLITGIRRVLYLATCEDWGFKPKRGNAIKLNVPTSDDLKNKLEQFHDGQHKELKNK